MCKPQLGNAARDVCVIRDGSVRDDIDRIMQLVGRDGTIQGKKWVQFMFFWVHSCLGTRFIEYLGYIVIGTLLPLGEKALASLVQL